MLPLRPFLLPAASVPRAMVGTPPILVLQANDPRADPRLDDPTLKKRYAAEQLRTPGQDMHIALGMIREADVALCAVNKWNSDPDVAAERLRLQQEYGQRAELPTKEDIQKRILAIADNEGYSVRDRLLAYKEYNEVAGYTGRNVPQQGNVNLFANKVMVLRDHGSASNWQNAAVKQQTGLVQAARDDAKRSETAH